MTKYSNFKFTPYTEGCRATVTERSGWLFPRTRTRRLVRKKLTYGYLNWRFADTGEMAPEAIDGLQAVAEVGDG